MPYYQVQTALFFNPITNTWAGPFAVNGAAYAAYRAEGGGWRSQIVYEVGQLVPIDYGDPENLGPFPSEPMPSSSPVIINQVPTGGGGVSGVTGSTPVVPGASGCYVWERFFPVSGDQSKEVIGWLGSGRWASIATDQSFIPSFRGVWPRNVQNDTANGNTSSPPADATRFDGDGNCNLTNVPQSSDSRGCYVDTSQGPFVLNANAPAGSTCGVSPQPKPATPLVPPAPTGQNCGFYDCPSNSGSGPCCHDYTAVFTSIHDAIEDVANKIASQTKSACDVSDSCIQEIYDKIWKKLSAVKKTCSQCCDAVRSGIAQSSEDAFICANMECNCASQECGMIGSQSQDGVKCTTCGQENCCCENNTCVPCPPNNKQVWHAYCDQSTGQIAITQDENYDAGEAILVGEYDTESEATDAANQYCGQRQQTRPQIPEEQPPQPPDLSSSLVCDVNSYVTAQGRSAMFGETGGVVLSTYLAVVSSNAIASAANFTQSIPYVGPVVGALAAASTNPMLMAGVLDPFISQLIGCGDADVEQAVQRLSARGVIANWVGVDLGPFTPHIDYAINAACPNRQMSPGDAMAVYMANAIDNQSLDSHYSIAGFCDGIAEKQIEALRKKLTPIDLAILRRRGEISESEYNVRIRQQGFTNVADASELFELTEQRPGISDIIRMMVRDTDDQNVVDTFQLDDQFTLKYGGQLKQWAADQGVPDKIMQYAWRAHWDIPAPTQLYVMLRRLRHNNAFNANSELETAIRQALVQQDILPYWIDKFLAIAYNPLSRIDVRRAFNAGSITEDQVRSSYWDQGYSDDNANILTAFTVKLRNQAAIGHRAIKQWAKFQLSYGDARQQMVDDGLPASVVDAAFKFVSGTFSTSWPVRAFIAGDMPSAEVRTTLQDWGVNADSIETILASAAPNVRTNTATVRYAGGTMDYETAIGTMKDYGMAESRADKLLDRIDAKIEASQAVACTNAIKHRFLLGEIDADTTEQQLQNNNIVADRAASLVSGWGCEKSANGKAVPTAELCGWLSNGTIGPLEFVQRLIRIGYNPKDAANILGDCQGKINLRQQQQVMKQAKANAAAIAKQVRQAKMIDAQLQRESAAITRAAKQAKVARDRRTKQIANIVEKLYKKSYGDVYTTQTDVNALYTLIRDSYALNPDETIAAMMQGAEAYSASGNTPYQSIVDGMAQAIVNKALEPDETAPL